jgi:hypothetical protein
MSGIRLRVCTATVDVLLSSCAPVVVLYCKERPKNISTAWLPSPERVWISFVVQSSRFFESSMGWC